MKKLFAFFSIFLLVALAVLGFIAHSTASWVFYLIEGMILITLIFLFIFYRKIVKPLHIIGSGMELLNEQDFSSRLSRVGQKEADKVVDVFNKMMEQLKNERLRLREQNHFLDLVINASPMGVVIVSLDGKITQLNPMAFKMFGMPEGEIMNKSLAEINSPLADELNELPESESRTIRLGDSNIYKCTHSFFIDKGFRHPFYLVESLTDEVIRAEKRAYEKVIRMIAHEVNNTTAGITSTLESVEDALAGMDNMEDICEVMRVCTERCYSMSRFITRFAEVVKIPDPHMIPADINELVMSCKHFMESMCNERSIQIQLEATPLPLVQMDVPLFEQVLVNIIKNAAESIDREGTITIRTVLPASIEIIDNGQGIPKEVEAKLFSPFFSTKPNGQGIGLIFIREVLTRHGCTFSLRTYSDGLTRFCIIFPLN